MERAMPSNAVSKAGLTMGMVMTPYEPLVGRGSLLTLQLRIYRTEPGAIDSLG